MPFSLKATAAATAAAKRPSDTSASDGSPVKKAKAPLFANLTLMDAPKRNIAQRLPPTAPVILCIYKVRRAFVVWSAP